MGQYSKICVCLFILLAFILNVMGQEDSTDYDNGMLPDNSNRKQLQCKYNKITSGHNCNCRNRNGLFVLEAISGNVNSLIIQNCKDLLLRQGTFADVGFINNVQFRNIDSLSLESYSLQFGRLSNPKIKLNFFNVNLHRMESYSMSGYIDSVSFNNSHIEHFNAYAINSISADYNDNVYSISFENTEINSIERQALKRLRIDHFTMKNTTFRSVLPSQTFCALTIANEISISNCSFTTINSQAIDLADVNDFIFADNEIDQMDAEAFKINVNGRIIIERNSFSQISHSALTGIHKGEKMLDSKKEIQFLSNIINSTDYPIRLEVDRELYLWIQDLKFSQIIDCEEAERLRQNSFLLPYADSVYFRFGDKTDRNLEYNSLSNISSTKCTATSYIVAIVSAVAVVALLVIIVVVAIFYRCLMKHAPPPRRLNMVVPDGKTYRETQIIMKVENAGLLKTNL